MSIKEIAEKAGVSIATVSRVLNNPNYHCAKPGLRDRIWQIAMEMNYAPNEAARSLKQKTASAANPYYIQILLTRGGVAGQTDPFFREVLNIVETQIHKENGILVDIQYREDYSDDRRSMKLDAAAEAAALRASAGSKCDGLIIIGKCSREILKALNACYGSIISINRNSTNQLTDEILCDGHKTAGIAVEYLISLGHTRIGYVGSCRNESRYRGFQEALARHGIDLIPEYVAETSQTEIEGYQVMERFLQSADSPTAIYCANDITAIGMLKYLSTRKRLPFRPSIIASDDIEAAQEVTPMLTTVALPKADMGRFAVYLLMDRIRGGHTGITRIEVEGRLIRRNSCQPLRF